MSNLLFVALGGALGASCRYGLSLLPTRTAFPVWTLVANLLGALLIGYIAGRAAAGQSSPHAVLFWKTGVCGGFTTFSTFSLEALGLLESSKTFLGLVYILLSVTLCLIGVSLGRRLAA